MASPDPSGQRGREVVARYRNIGLIGGVFLGAIAGIVIAGPSFATWSATRVVLTIFGSTALGALIGYVAGEIAVASLVSGGGPGIGTGGSETRSGGSGSGGGLGEDGGGDG